MDETSNPFNEDDADDISFATDNNASTEDPFSTLQDTDNIALLQQSSYLDQRSNVSTPSSLLQGAKPNKKAPTQQPAIGISAQIPPSKQHQIPHSMYYATPTKSNMVHGNIASSNGFQKQPQPTNLAHGPLFWNNGTQHMPMHNVNSTTANPYYGPSPSFPFNPPIHHQQQQFHPQQFQSTPGIYPEVPRKPSPTSARIQELEARLNKFEITQHLDKLELKNQMNDINTSLSTTLESKNQEMVSFLSNFQKEIKQSLQPQHLPSQKESTPSLSPPIDLLTPEYNQMEDKNAKPSPSPPVTATTTIGDNKNITIHLDAPQQKNIPLKFKHFHPNKDDYRTWKDGCFSRIYTNDDLKTAMIKDEKTNSVQLNPQMSDRESRIIVQETIDHLENSDHFTTGTSILDIKATSLWDTMDAFYIKPNKTTTDHAKLISQWASFERKSNESIADVSIRFRQLVQNIRDAPEAPLIINHKLEIHTFLRCLNDPVVNDTILMDFKDEWYVGQTILSLVPKVTNHIDHVKEINPKYKEKYNNKALSEQILQYLKKANGKHQGKSNGSNDTSKQFTKDGNTSGGKSQDQTPQDSNYYTKLADTLTKCDDKIAYLTKCVQNNRSKFMDREFKRTCSKTNSWDAWMEVAKQNDVHIPKSTARRVAAGDGPPAWMQDYTQNLFQQQEQHFKDQLASLETSLLESGSSNKTKAVTFADAVKGGNTGQEAPTSEVINDKNNNEVKAYPYSPLFQRIALLRAKMVHLQQKQSRHKSETTSTTNSPTHSTSNATLSPDNLSASSPPPWNIKCKYIPTSSYLPKTSKAVSDSGSTDTLSGDASLFEHISHFVNDINNPAPTVTLGDDVTTHPIQGYGWMNYMVDGRRIRQKGYYVPNLGNITLISIINHMKYKGNFFHCENNTATLAYPTFIVDLQIAPELQMEISPASHLTTHFDYDEQTAILSNINTTNKDQCKLRMVSTEVAQYISNPSAQQKFSHEVKIMKLVESAHIPQKGTPNSIGYDVRAITNTTINPGQIQKVGTGLSTAFSNDLYLRIAPRSSLALKHITVEGGVVDSDYRGEITVLLKNNSNDPYNISAGDKIAQFIFEQAASPLISISPTLPPTVRGKGGFGSTTSPKPTSSSRRTKSNKRSSLCHDTFRIDKNTVIQVNYSNPFRPIARRVKVPLPSPIEMLHHYATPTPEAEELQDVNDFPKQHHQTPGDEHTTTLKLHPIKDNSNSPVEKILSVAMEPLPTSLTTHPSVLPAHEAEETLQFADDEIAIPPNLEADDISVSDHVQPSPLTDHIDIPFVSHDPSNISDPPTLDDSSQSPLDIVTTEDPPSPLPTVTTVATPENIETASSEEVDNATPPPTPRPVDRVNSSTPKTISLSQDALFRSIGFLNPKMLQQHLNLLGNKSVRIQNLAKNPTVDPGETASMPSRKRNKIPSQPARHYGDIWHVDIGYGPNTAIGGIKYTIMFIDKYSKYKLIYGLKNLTSSLHDAVRKFLRDCGTTPNLIRTDFDHKLIGGTVADILTSEKIRIEAAPPYRQHQNGLVERHWQTMVNMARNWLTSAMLPSTYWYLAIKRACEVLNIMPVRHQNNVYKKKVDYRSLIPLFCIAYIKQPRFEGQDKNSWASKSLKCILVGKCDKSDSLLFYHPPSKQLLSCADGYRLDTHSPPGPHFDQHYDGDFIFNLKSDDNQAIHQPPSHEENSTIYFQTTPGSYTAGTILSIPINEETEPYIIQQTDTGDIHEMLADEITDHDPNSNPSDFNTSLPFPHLPWIQHDEKATLYLPHIMAKPKQGYLQYTNNSWTFIPGRNKNHEPIPLPQFETLADSMVNNKKLFKGWVQTARAISARRTKVTANCLAHLIIARKVSAKDLHKMEAPTLLKHHKLHPEDKNTWDEAYRQEYQGLVDIDTWEVISEEKYINMKHILGNLLPTMAISTIKHDGNGKPTRAKYRIVALGNLDPHNWAKQDCFAPVLSQMELRFLTALAVRKKCIPKSGDITQAFCQSYLPEGENYVLRPPPGCPMTPPKSYLLLKKTLYGLKRSPRHFYELAKRRLQEIGLKQHPYSPCLFYGELIEGEPPIYLGLYI